MYSGLLPWNLTTTVNALLVSLIFFFFFFLIKKWMKSKPNSVKQLPPGPKKLQIIVNLHLIRSTPFLSFRDLAKQYGPIMHLTLGEAPVFIVSSPEIAKQILKDNEPNYADRPRVVALEIMWYNYTDIKFSPHGGYWREIRKICINELLSPRSVRSFGSIQNDKVSRFIESIHLSFGEPINLTERVFALASSITCRAAFGKVCKDKDALIKLVMDGLRMTIELEIADLYPSSKIINALSWGKLISMTMRRKLDVILDDVIKEHGDNLMKMATENAKKDSRNGEFGNEDLVDVLLRVKKSGELEFPFGNDNIKAILFDMFTAGTEASSSTIDWTMTKLMRNPLVMAMEQAEVRQAFKGSSNTMEEHDVQK